MSIPPSPGFQPNFSTSHSIILDYPLSRTFPVLAHGSSMESSVRLSDLVSRFDLLECDTINIPASVPLSQISVRTWPSSSSVDPKTTTATTTSTPNVRVLSRQSFHLEEIIPLIFGLFTQVATINGTFTCDEEAKVALYESLEDSQGILVWKLREFEEVVDGEGKETKTKTRITESIKGRAPAWLKGIVERTTRKAHVLHMESYHTLFE